MFLAHDLGTTGDKATLHDRHGALLGAVTVAYETRYAAGGIVEQDPVSWWTACCAATKALAAQTAVPLAAIECVSFSGHMMGAVLVDGAGEAVRPAMIWADTRAVEQCDQLIDRVGLQRGYQLTGHRLNPTYPLAKLMWVRDNEPEAWARTAVVCQAKDFLVYRLTGTLVTDPSDASSTNAFDQRAGAWSDELLAAAGIDGDRWPEVVASTTVVGHVLPEVADEVGLLAGTPVVLGGGDGPCAATGAARIAPEDGAYCYLGSSSWVSVAAHEPLADPEMQAMTFSHVIGGRYLPTATMQAGGASLEWAVELLDPDGGPGRWERLLAAAESVTAADDGLLFLPHLLGERSPYWEPRSRGAFIGLSRRHGRPEVVRAVMEGVAMNLRTCLGSFEAAGVATGPIDVIGGGARSATWLQICADVWGVEVRQRSLAEEATSLGAAVVGAVGVGAFDDFTPVRGFSRVERTFVPDPVTHLRYVRRHEQFLEAYRSLARLLTEL